MTAVRRKELVGVVVLAFFAVAFFLLIIFLVLVWVGASVWAISKALRGGKGEVQGAAEVPAIPPGSVDDPEATSTEVSAAHSARRD